MLSLLLAAQAAIDTYEQPAALCPPCHPEAESDSFLSVVVSMLKSCVSLLVILFPLYKTFKAFESNRLRACRTMLAYWSAMTLLNALQDVTDELVGKHINATLHHLLIAALKMAPLVLGPDYIYDNTVRSFFEQHEAEVDAMVLTGVEKAQEIKHRLEPTLDKVKHEVAELKEKGEKVIHQLEERAEPTLEQIRESLREGVDTVKSTLGMEKAQEPADPTAVHELSAEEAVRRDEELTVVEDNSSKTGLRQRSARPDASSASPTGVTSDAELEIERAKARNVLVEKIVWGHGLSAKNNEYQRQMSEKEAEQDDMVADVHTVANQFNTVPAQSPAVQPAAAYGKTTTVDTAVTAAAPAVAVNTATYTNTSTNTSSSSIIMTNTATATNVAPPLPPRPVATEAITITNSTAQPTITTTGSSLHSASHSASSAGVTTTVLDSRTAGATGSKTILLDTRSIPSVVETYAADYHKEL